MIVTVSTVKEPVSTLERFVRGNLGHGVDHLVVCTDAPDREAEAFLDAHPHVTHVRAYDDWWAGARPDSLNARQRANANVVRGVLDVLGGADWLFHIDADEVVLLDPDVLAALPDDQAHVSLQVLEAVARPEWHGVPTLFKRVLDPDELALLTMLGLIQAPHNRHYLRGHLAGKSGVRTDGRAFPSIHRALDAAGGRLPPAPGVGLRVLHFDSPSFGEFVAKWRKMAKAGGAGHRRGRNAVSDAIRAVLDKPLDDRVRDEYLARIFAAARLDPEEDLARLGLLEEHRLDRDVREPQPWPDRDRCRFEDLLAAVRPEDKEQFWPSAWPGTGRPRLVELAASADGGGP